MGDGVVEVDDDVDVDVSVADVAKVSIFDDRLERDFLRWKLLRYQRADAALAMHISLSLSSASVAYCQLEGPCARL